MAFVTPTTPNLVDFETFLSTSVQIPVAALPVNSVWPGYAFNQAMALVLCPPYASGILYVLAVYNCATHILFKITPDQTGQTYFANARSSNPTGFSLNTPSTGIVSTSSDQGTSATVATPDWATGLTIGQLEFFRTPWGREYLSWQQSYGSTIVGLT